MDKNIQLMFFSKDNISNLNKKVLEILKPTNLTVELKKEIVETIIENMKKVWVNIDRSKINNTNFNHIFGQFNTFSLQYTITQLKNKYSPGPNLKSGPNSNSGHNSNYTGINTSNPHKPVYPQNNASELNNYYNNLSPNLPDMYNNNNNVDASTLKFQRDFNMNQGKSVQVPDRSRSVMGANEKYIRQSQENQRLANNFQSGIDSLFAPLIDNPPDEPTFNNYNFNKGDGDIKKRMDDIKYQRNNETYMPRKPQQDDVPDFLKPKATSIRSQDDYREQREPQKKVSFQQSENKKSSMRSGGSSANEFLSGHDDDCSGDLMSLDNFDRPITDDNIVEDNSSFSDRLNRLKKDRDNISVPKRTVDFTSDDFEDTYDDVEPTTIKNIKKKTKKYGL